MEVQKAVKVAAALAFVFATTSTSAPFADSNPGLQNIPASESMRQAGEHTEQAAHSAYQGAKTAIKDTEITLKIKKALHDDSVTKASDIHVSTTAGVVTLAGRVQDAKALAHAQDLAHSTYGVREVVSDIQVASATH